MIVSLIIDPSSAAVTGSAECSRPFRLASDSTDPMLIVSLTELAAEYTERAKAIDALALGQDPQR